MALYETFEYMCCYGDEKRAYKRWLRMQLEEQSHEGIEETSLGNITEETGLLASDALAYNGASHTVSTNTNLTDGGPATSVNDTLSHSDSSASPVPLAQSSDVQSKSLPQNSSSSVPSKGPVIAGSSQKPSTSAKKTPPKDNVLMHVPKTAQYVAMERFDDLSDEEDEDLLFNVRQHLLSNH